MIRCLILALTCCASIATAEISPFIMGVLRESGAIVASGYVQATGGIVTNYAEGGTNFQAHLCYSNVTISITSAGTVEYIVGAGGGAGGYSSPLNSYAGGGGGAGGILVGTIAVSVGYLPIAIGAGGTPATNNIGAAGSNTIFSSLVATGGGYGARGGVVALNGGDGGSGGAGTYSGMYGLGLSGQGMNGATSIITYGSSGGGGGKMQAGIAPTNVVGGGGGRGVTNTFSGVASVYGGGGGGGGYSAAAVVAGGAGGNGGGGRGGLGANTARTAGTNAVANTSGGGGGSGAGLAGAEKAGGSGASGFAIFRYEVGP